MKTNADKLLEELKKQEVHKGGRVTIYFRNMSLWKQFQVACDTVAPSRVIEALIKDFLGSKKKK